MSTHATPPTPGTHEEPWGTTAAAPAAEEPLLASRAATDAGQRKPPCRRWWLPGLALGVALGVLTALAALGPAHPNWFEPGSNVWWALAVTLHLPYLVILLFLLGGLVERVGFYWRGRLPHPGGRLPAAAPSVCVQLPMFNEREVAQRCIEAAGAMTWPTDRLTVQVLDDSTDAETRAHVAEVCSRVRDSTGIDCYVLHRTDRVGYKAGALEAGRKATEAEFLVVLDADFVPGKDFLSRTVPHFFDADGEPDEGLALVQTQWGHLNHDESFLTLAQSLWVDDHHTLQMSWRSATWRFVNFTGTAGVWRAAAIEAAGGWRAASLVEDCELSFRILFAGYRTTFVKEIVVPAELPATYTAYKAQQKRWTQGWAQLQRLHLGTLLHRHQCTLLRRLHLIYHMCVPWQWPAWAVWILTLPLLIHGGLWFPSVGPAPLGALLYLMPQAIWLVLVTTEASLETRHTYAEPLTPSSLGRRCARIVPYLIINTGMLPHQFSAFAEGMFGAMHSEFERTPKAASVTCREPQPGQPGVVHGSGCVGGPPPGSPCARDHRPGMGPVEPPARVSTRDVKIHHPYVLTEAFYVAYQVVWMVLFARAGLLLCAVGAAYLAACVVYLAWFYGDHAGRRLFVLDGSRLLRGSELARVRQGIHAG